MYLTDREIRARLPELNIEAIHPAHPFDPETQIQPCSIDLRLSNTFWKPTKTRRPIDLRRKHLIELSPGKFHRAIRLGDTGNQYVDIKPGELILGCIYEKISVPEDCAAKFEGRSSFSRLGLSVHCTCDFANPGYRGHMPLQLFNASPNTIRLFPFISVCQMMLVPLSERPSRIYGDDPLDSKYADDNGGPSYWWKDKALRRLQSRLESVDTWLAVGSEILLMMSDQEPEVLRRFDDWYAKTNLSPSDDLDAVLDAFSKTEDSRRRADSFRLYFLR